MKKYVITQQIGRYTWREGKRVIDCTVADEVFVADSNDWEKLWKIYQKHSETIYQPNGIWRSLKIYRQRTEAKYWLDHAAIENNRLFD